MTLNYYFQCMIPNIKGITEVQRKGKKAFQDILLPNSKSGVIYLAERNKIFAVVLSIQEYEKMTGTSSKETDIWAKASESSLEFWNDPSNDTYDQLT